MPNTTRRFRKAVRELNAVLEEVRKKHPAANYYVTPSMIHLMKGESHTGSEARAARANIHASEMMPCTGGGDW